jgi:hypothetical protein
MDVVSGRVVEWESDGVMSSKEMNLLLTTLSLIIHFYSPFYKAQNHQVDTLHLPNEFLLFLNIEETNG